MQPDIKRTITKSNNPFVSDTIEFEVNGKIFSSVGCGETAALMFAENYLRKLKEGGV